MYISASIWVFAGTLLNFLNIDIKELQALIIYINQFFVLANIISVQLILIIILRVFYYLADIGFVEKSQNIHS